MPDSDLRCIACNSRDLMMIAKVETKKIPRLLYEQWNLKIMGSVNYNKLLRCKYIRHYICRKCDVGSWFPPIPGDEKYYDEISKTYVARRWDKEIVQKFFKGANSILDVGSGPRPVFLGIKKRPLSTDFILDQNPFVISTIKKMGINFAYTIDELEAKRIRFSHISALHFLEHISAPHQVMIDLSKLLRKNGEIWISVPNRERLGKDFEAEPFDMPPHHLTTWTLDSLIILGQRVGLEIGDIWVSKVWPKNIFLKFLHKYFLSQYIRLDYSDIVLDRNCPYHGYQFLVRYIK